MYIKHLKQTRILYIFLNRILIILSPKQLAVHAHVRFSCGLSIEHPPVTMWSLSPAVVSLLLLVSACEGQVARVRDSPVTCSDEGLQCEVIANNVIDAVLNIDTLMECRQLCLDDANCQFHLLFR